MSSYDTKLPSRCNPIGTIEQQLLNLTKIVNNLLALVNEITPVSGNLAGYITMVVGGTSTFTIVLPYSTVTTTALVMGTTYTNILFNNYNIILYGNGSGILIPGVDYSLSGSVITRLNSQIFNTGQVYYIHLFNK